MARTRAERIAELEAWGLAEVRRKMAAREIRGPDYPLAEWWVPLKEAQERDSAAVEELALIRRATGAAEASARSAKWANRIAIAAAAIAVAALIVSIVTA